ncbi:MAG: tRNA dihydrouridine synthase DusB [Clostridiales bacterium]|jgi:nifR3 family TIM-barrel protein|nr:tRNA dihydrouridine synthase DusB [Clostridiales bacterium]
MKIGNLELENNIFLAPMAGITDLPFRILCKEAGCGLVYSEMVSAKGVYFANKNTGDLLKADNCGRPSAVQIFGSSPEIMAQIAAQLDEYDFDILDINMGCPAPKIVKNFEGSALMLKPGLVGQIVNSVARSTRKPVTVKIRKGFDEQNVNAIEIAKIIEANGASAVAVHGRTRSQYYSGAADWGIIKGVKKAVNIPVIGNGDIKSPEMAKQMLEHTGCDAVMIGRAAQGDPYIFKRVTHYLKTGVILDDMPFHEKMSLALRHLDMLAELKGEYIAIREMRRHLPCYTKGVKNSAALRAKINSAVTKSELTGLMKNLG